MEVSWSHCDLGVHHGQCYNVIRMSGWCLGSSESAESSERRSAVVASTQTLDGMALTSSLCAFFVIKAQFLSSFDISARNEDNSTQHVCLNNFYSTQVGVSVVEKDRSPGATTLTANTLSGVPSTIAPSISS